MAGLKASENRKRPPLRYARWPSRQLLAACGCPEDFVYRLQEERPELEIVLNGGICSLEDMEVPRSRGD